MSSVVDCNAWSILRARAFRQRAHAFRTDERDGPPLLVLVRNNLTRTFDTVEELDAFLTELESQP